MPDPADSASPLHKLFPTRAPSMLAMLETVGKVMEHDVSIFITGETGVGKDFLAQLIHARSPRNRHPFVGIDCAGIPPELFESELFGYEKGAFTDAAARKLGRFELAQHGTVYLDEVAALGLGLQAKLLRVIQEKKFSRLGSNRTIDADVRFISSSSIGAGRLLEQSSFRKDLYYRLNVVSLEIPPLRERRADIGLLAKRFLGEAKKRYGKRVSGFDPEVLEEFSSYSWPGNVRELRNVIDRALILEQGPTLSLSSLPREHFASTDDLVYRAVERKWTLAELETRYIREVLRLTGANYSRAASILGINRKTLLEKRKRYGIEG